MGTQRWRTREGQARGQGLKTQACTTAWFGVTFRWSQTQQPPCGGGSCTSAECPQKIKTDLPQGPAIPPLGIYPKKSKTLIQKAQCTHVHCSVIYNNHDEDAAPCPWTDKQVRSHRSYIQQTITKKKEILPFATARTAPEGSMLSKGSDREKSKYHGFLLHVESKERTNKRETESELLTGRQTRAGLWVRKVQGEEHKSLGVGQSQAWKSQATTSGAGWAPGPPGPPLPKLRK